MTTILAIDDKQDNLVSLSALLKHYIPGCRVITALSGLDGIQQAKQEQPDTILLDLHMPGMDGFQVCEQLKNSPETRHIPIIILTAVRTEPQKRAIGLELGADAFLSKPFDEVELAGQIKAMLRIKRAENLLRQRKDALEALVQERLEALQESEANYKKLFEQSNDAIFIHDSEGRILDCNQFACQMLGFDKSRLQAMSVVDLHLPEEAAPAREALRQALEFGGIRLESQFRRTDGLPINVEISSAVIDQEKGIIQGIVRDITERKRAELSLRKNEEKLRKLYEESSQTAELYRSLIHSSADAIIICDLEDKVQYVSPAFTQIFGWDIEEIRDSQIPYFPGKHEDYAIDPLRRVITEGTPVRAVRTRRKTKDGRLLEVSISASRYSNHEGRPTGLLYIIQDITDTKRLEAQLQQAQKMEAIGTLASGIAHDFNNILGAIIGYTELSLFDIEKSNPAYRNLQDSLKAANRAKHLVKQILTFSRQSQHQFNPVKLSPIIKEVLKFLRSTLPTTIEIRYQIQDQMDVVMADPTKIHQIMMNLCTNAAYSMKETGGVLEVKLADMVIDSEAGWYALKPGHYVQLTVSDTGTGMDKETLNRLFEPYFTTKPQGEGTGMGLAVVHGIVQSHGGAIKVYSEPGQGTSFHIFLPVVRQQASSGVESESAIPKGSERIMYIDDEEAIVDIGQQMLQRLGYTVETRTDSYIALEYLKTHGNEFDLIITDQTMPKLTGAQLARELIQIYPDLPIILCTGFSESISEERAKNLGIQAFLMKPFILKDLAVSIRSVLDRSVPDTQ